MCEPDPNTPVPPLSPSRSTSPCTPQSHLQPNSPEIFARYSPKLAKRMQADKCFRCHQQGHWSWDCPLNSPKTKTPSPNTITPNHYSPSNKIWCRCGHGFCEEKTSRSQRSYGRKYYICPIKRGKKCKDFVKWCDDPIDDSDLQPPPYKYPECECGAGVCRKVKDTENPDAVKDYFACPIPVGHGSCSYQVSEDKLLDNNKSIVPIQQSCQRTLHDFWEGYQNDKTDKNLGEGGALLLANPKRMRITENSEIPLSMVASELPEREDAALKAAPSEHVGLPEFEVADDLHDLDLANSLPWDAIEEEACLLFRLLTPSRIRRRQNLFQRHMFADASFGSPCPMGWLGRLLFFHPTHSLKCPPPPPYLCCVYPSFNPIVVPNGECNHLAISNLSQHAQLSTGCNTEVSRDAVSSNKPPASDRKPMSKAERQRQVVLFAQQQLLIELQNLDPHEHESMREAAEDTFAVLDNLGVNYKHFSDLVWDFINNTSSVVEIDKSLENFLSPQEYNQRYEEDKLTCDNIRNKYVKTKDLFEAVAQRRQSLREEVSHLEAMLYEKQNQLTSCDLEMLKMETNLGDINRSMLEADTNLKIRAEQAEVARKLSDERQTKLTAAQTALENAKLALENDNI